MGCSDEISCDTVNLTYETITRDIGSCTNFIPTISSKLRYQSSHGQTLTNPRLIVWPSKESWCRQSIWSIAKLLILSRCKESWCRQHSGYCAGSLVPRRFFAIRRKNGTHICIARTGIGRNGCRNFVWSYRYCYRVMAVWPEFSSCNVSRYTVV